MSRKSGSGSPHRNDTQDALHPDRELHRPESRVEYEAPESLHRVVATPVPRCPDCGADPDRTLAQYVHRSSLVRLKACGSCELIWADVHLDEAGRHEQDSGAPAGEEGQGEADLDHGPIRSHLSDLICSRAESKSSVLEIGGGKGHVLSRVRDERPDLCLVLQDTSSTACRYAETHFGLATLCGELDVLETLSRPFDVVVVDEVLSYVQDLARAWRMLAHVVAEGGTLILRMTSRPSLVRLGAALERAAVRLGRSEPPERIRFFDPEQLYVMTPDFLRKRLGALGFDTVRTRPAPSAVVSEGWTRRVRGMGFQAADLLHRISGGTIAPATSAFSVVAVRST